MLKAAVLRNKIRFRPSPPQIMTFGFILLIFIGAQLLTQPISYTNDIGISYLDALFMSASATCVTGLTVLSTGTHFSTFGQVVIIALAQIGGLGFMTMATLFALLFRKKISFRERLVLQESMNYGSNEGIVRMIRKVLLYALVIELTGAVLLSGYFMLEMPVGRSIYFGIFHSISFFNNAGFDLFSQFPDRPSSLIHYAEDPFVNVVSMLLIFFGGIGFIVISELVTYPKNRKLSLHSKVVLSVTGLLTVLGAIVIFALELSNPHTLQPLSAIGKFLSSMFQSVTARSAGLSTVDPGLLREATQFFLVLLMFIGAGPGSTGGGIRVTTFAILIGAIVAMMRGKDDVVLFRYRIAKQQIHQAIMFTMIAFSIICAGTMILSITETGSFLAILFEATSAYCTVGMSAGLTSHISEAGKIIIIVLMFVGRLGPVTLAFALNTRSKKELYRFPEGKITIG
ncbi:Trk family potassium uptake protein [Paenibacillus sp. FSL H8-0548]|uniref:TrkH family potassium uptake protein n=1 Tax=Paenibacillus sp. FSL H8-0548 TaxID=1920422 RepID=UPI00096EB19F|nr:TrkH family potassium uptake protein [Paenibacillus sp. FSL H8-0548]OMF37293.1 Trk family potassium uptake protein [Paenibacillus sp. FSL H8-0548]